MRCTLVALLFIAWPLHADDLGLKVPPNFKVTLWADHTLANDILTMALDEKGRVVVSGPGYVRLLEDTKGAGKADKATEVEKTRSGLMGLCYVRNKQIDQEDWNSILSGDGKLVERMRWASSTERKPLLSDNILLDRWKFSEHGG